MVSKVLFFWPTGTSNDVCAVCTYISILPRSDMLRKMGNSNAKINDLKFKVCMLKFSSVPKYFISLFPPTNDFLFNDGS